MSLHGDALGADLYDLLVVAKRDLPSIAEIYAYCVSEADKASSLIDKVMWRPSDFGTGAYGPVHEPWISLYDELRKFLSQTESNLTETARALNLAVDAYQELDTQAGDKLRALCNDDGYPKPDPLKVMP